MDILQWGKNSQTNLYFPLIQTGGEGGKGVNQLRMFTYF